MTSDVVRCRSEVAPSPMAYRHRPAGSVETGSVQPSSATSRDRLTGSTGPPRRAGRAAPHRAGPSWDGTGRAEPSWDGTGRDGPSWDGTGRADLGRAAQHIIRPHKAIKCPMVRCSDQRSDDGLCLKIHQYIWIVYFFLFRGKGHKTTRHLHLVVALTAHMTRYNSWK